MVVCPLTQREGLGKFASVSSLLYDTDAFFLLELCCENNRRERSSGLVPISCFSALFKK